MCTHFLKKIQYSVPCLRCVAIFMSTAVHKHINANILIICMFLSMYSPVKYEIWYINNGM